MNVLGVVSFRVFPTHMGGQKGVAHFYKYLERHANVLLAVSNDNQQSKIPNEKTLFPNKKIYKNFFRRNELKKIAEKHNTDVIIAEHSYAGWIAWLLSKSIKKPFIIHSHNIESKRFHQMNVGWWRFYHWYEGWIHRKAHHSFFISEEDKNFAIKNFKLDPSKCSVITYGIEDIKPQQNKSQLKNKLELDENKRIILFNGTLDYTPNFDAVVNLIEKIEPLLRQRIDNFQILITGNRARKNLIDKILAAKNVLYLGYVEDVNLYYQAADLFINPVSNDTGIKTKLVEAIANNCTTISTESGASGIKKELCGEKLVTVKDNDWNSFTEKIVEYKNSNTFTPEAFYEFYSWKNIAEKAAKKLKELAAE